MHTRLQSILHACVILVLLAGVLPPLPVQAAPPPPVTPQSGDEPPARRSYNPRTGTLSMIASEPQNPLISAGQGASALSREGAAAAAVAHWAGEFGITDAVKNLRLEDTLQTEDGTRMRYQQQVNGIPVLGGELLVNLDVYGNVISINGEVSKQSHLNSKPAVRAERAVQAAIAGMQTWYGLEASAVQAEEAALWLYDPRLFGPPSAAKAVLVWRVVVVPTASDMPVRELVLVNAATGAVALHFNQVDAGWFAPPGQEPIPQESQEPTPEPTQQPELEPAPEMQMPAPAAEDAIFASATRITWYVANWGSDSYSCATPADPCETVNAAVRKASAGDAIYVAQGVYTVAAQGVIMISKNLELHGGWNRAFTAQIGYSTFDGQDTSQVMRICARCDANTPIIQVSATLSRLEIVHGTDNAVYGQDVDSLTLLDSNLHHNTGTTMSVQGNNMLVSGSSFHHNTLTSIYTQRHTGLVVRLRSLTVRNSTFTANTTRNGSGGITIMAQNRYTPTQVTLSGVTISGNSSNNEAAGLVWDSQGERGTLTVQNTILAGNAGRAATPECNLGIYAYGITTVSQGHNLWGDLTGCDLTPGEADISGEDPRLGPPDWRGIVLLRPGSPALDRGDACEATDQVGTPRALDGDGDGTAQCDIGAYEAPGPLAQPGLTLLGGDEQRRPLGGQYATLSVLALDASGNPFSGAQVTFTAPASSASGTFAGGGTTAKVSAGNDGVAIAPLFSANTEAGTFMVEASLEGASPALFTLENVPAIPDAINHVSGSNQVADYGQPFPVLLRALVRDAYDNPLAGVAVTFTAPETGASGTFASAGSNFVTAITGADGIATAPEFKANDQKGVYDVRATLPELDKTLLFRLINMDYLYVSQAGSDTSNDCRYPETPCKTLEYAYTLANPGATALLTAETYSVSLWMTKNFNISGGWNADFTDQSELTTFVGPGTSNYNRALELHSSSKASISRVRVLNHSNGIINNGTMDVRDSVLLQNGRGISAYGHTTVTNSTISNNGTGLVTNSTLTLRYTTIADNSSSGVSMGGNTNARLNIFGSLLARNAPNCNVSVGTVTSLGGNVFDSTPGCVSTSGSIPLHASDRLVTNARISPLIGERHHAAASDSPALDMIDPAAAGSDCPATDIRGKARPVNGRCDAGSFEWIEPGVPSNMIYISGLPQGVLPGHAFPLPLRVLVMDADGGLVAGAPVTFRAPDSGASVVFDGNGNAVTVYTGQDGVATSPAFTANALIGAYDIVATSPGVSEVVTFSLGNAEATRYLDGAWGNDIANDCTLPSAPCKTLQYVLDLAGAGELIKVTASTLPAQNSYDIKKSLTLLGGWDIGFTRQTGVTTISGILNRGQVGIYVYPNVALVADRFNIQQVDKAIMSFGALELTNSAVYGTRRGVNLFQDSAKLSNVTITGNGCPPNKCSQEGSSSVLTVYGGTTELNHVTIADNAFYASDPRYIYIPTAGGIHVYNGTVMLRNSVVANNHTNLGFDCMGTVTSLGHNLIGSNRGCDINAAAGDVIGSLDQPLDARIGFPALVAGMYVSPLLEGSPAIDGADGVDCPATDVRGAARPDGAGCDMGAYEGSQIGESAFRIKTFTANYDDPYPGELLCQLPATSCTGGSDRDADAAHTYALGTAQLFLKQLGRRSVDGNNMPILSTVHSHLAENNAFWSGTQMVYGEGYPQADDVVAHELTHGMESYLSNLFYYYESGAISESLSDLFGEYYDQINGMGKDSPALNWFIAEDAPGGQIRSMSDPKLFKDPDRVKSTYYRRSLEDNGGVHHNSGVNNKAVFLMVSGGEFNARKVTAIGWEKTAAIYYYAMQNLLTSGADYGDLYNVVNQACTVLVGGEKGISASDCQQVRAALDAVEMNQTPIPAYRPEATFCPTGTSRSQNNLFFDDFENGDNQWNFGATAGSPRWSIVPGEVNLEYAVSGEYALFGNNYDALRDDLDQRSDTYAALASGILVPEGRKTFLHFQHAYSFEWLIYGGNSFYLDGGVLEYSVDNAKTWQDAKSLYSSGQKYNGSLYNAVYEGSNPLRGRDAFRGSSPGYVSSRFDLSRFAGKTVLLRWRLGTDYSGYDLGWVLDDVAVYSCLPTPSSPSLSSPSDGALVTTYLPRLNWGNTSNAETYQLEIADEKTFVAPLFRAENVAISEYTLTEPLAANRRYYWRVRGVNSASVGKWSKTRSFRTPLHSPALIAPLSTTPLTLRPEFRWEAVDEASGYNLVVSNSASFSSAKIKVTVTGTSYIPTSDLSAGKTTYWRVRAAGANPSNWSSGSFTTPIPPGIPSVVAPKSNQLLYMRQPSLSWKSSTIRTGTPAFRSYELDVDDNSDFSSPLFQVTDLIETTVVMPEQALNLKLFWRVRGCNVENQCSAWAASTFRIAMDAPVPVSPLTGGSSLTDTTPDFQWQPVDGAASYTIVVSTYASFRSPLINKTVSAQAYTSTKTLPKGKLLYWRVRANGSNGPGSWSTGQQFQIQ